MEEFYPSEVARLVLGYLHEVDCTKSWQVFLEESVDLQEYCRLYKQKKNCSTNVQGESLLDILKAYRALKSFFEQLICQYSWKAVLEDITYLQEHYSKYKQKTHCPVYKSGQSVVNALQDWISKIPSNETSKSTSLPNFYDQHSERHPSSIATSSQTLCENNQVNLQDDQNNQKTSDKNIQTDQCPVSCHQNRNLKSNTQGYGVGGEYLQKNGVNPQFRTLQKDSVVSDTLRSLDKQNEENGEICASKDISKNASSLVIPENLVSASAEKITNIRFEEIKLPHKHECNSSSSKNIQPGTPFKLDDLENMTVEEIARHPEVLEIIKLLSSNRNCTESNNCISANLSRSTEDCMSKQNQHNDCGETNKISNLENNERGKNSQNTVDLDIQNHAVLLSNQDSSSKTKSNDNTSLESKNSCDVQLSDTTENVLHVIDPLKVCNLASTSEQPDVPQVNNICQVSLSTEIKNASYVINDVVPKKDESKNSNHNNDCATIIVSNKTDLPNDVSANAFNPLENNEFIIEENAQEQEVFVNKDALSIDSDPQVPSNNNPESFSVEKDKVVHEPVQNPTFITQSGGYRDESTENQFNKSGNSKENLAESVDINQNNVQVKEFTVQQQNTVVNVAPIQPSAVYTLSTVPGFEVPTYSTDWANNVQYRLFINTPLSWNVPNNFSFVPSVQPTIVENQSFLQSAPANTATSEGNFQKVQSDISLKTAKAFSIPSDPHPGNFDVCTLSSPHELIIDASPDIKRPTTDASPDIKLLKSAEKVVPSKDSKPQNVIKENLSKKKCDKPKPPPGKKRFYPKRPPKRGSLSLFPSTSKTKTPKKVKEQSDIYPETDAPVLSISEGNSALGVAAHEVVSKITSEFEEQCQSPVLKLLMSNANEMIKIRNNSKSSHVRNLNFNLNATIKEPSLDMPNIQENSEVQHQGFENLIPNKILKSPNKNTTQNSVTKCDAQGRAKTVTKNAKKNESCNQNEKDLAIPDVKNKVQKGKKQENIKSDKSPKKSSKVKNTKSRSPKKGKKVTAAKKKKSKKKESPVTSKSKKKRKAADGIKKSKKGNQVTDKDSLNNIQNFKENVNDNSGCHSNKRSESFENREVTISNNKDQLCKDITDHVFDNTNISKRDNEILESNQIHESEKENSQKHDCNKENKSQEDDEEQIVSNTKISKEETMLLTDKNSKLLIENEKEWRNNKFTTNEINNAKQTIEKKSYLEESVSQIRRSKRIKKSTFKALASNSTESSNFKQGKSFETNNNHLSTPNKRKMSLPKKWTKDISDIPEEILPNNVNKTKQLEVSMPLSSVKVQAFTEVEPAVKKVIEKVKHENEKSDLDNRSSSSKDIHRQVDQDPSIVYDDTVDLCMSEDEEIFNSKSGNFIEKDKIHHVSEQKDMGNDKTKLKNLVISFDPGKKSRTIKKSEELVQMKKTVFSGDDFSPVKACECDLQDSSDLHNHNNKSIESRDNFLIQDSSSDTLPVSNSTQTKSAENSVLNKNFHRNFSPSKSSGDRQNPPFIDSSGKEVISIEQSNPRGYSKTGTPFISQKLPGSNIGKNVFSSDERRGENFVPYKKSETQKSYELNDKSKVLKTLSARCKHSRFEKPVSIERVNCEYTEGRNKNGACAVKRKLSEHISDTEKTPQKNENFCDFELPLKKRSCRKLSSSSDELYSNTSKNISNDTHQELTDSLLNDKCQDFSKDIEPAASSLQSTNNRLVHEDSPKNLIGECKKLQDSPVKCTSKIKKNTYKSALSKKIEEDPNIPAGVKIPSKWNNSKIITYSDEIRQSTKATKKKEKQINPSGKKGKVPPTKNTVKSTEQEFNNNKPILQQKTLPKKVISSVTLPEDQKLHGKPYVVLSELPKNSIQNSGNKQQDIEEKVVDLSINLEQEHAQTVKTNSEEKPNQSSGFSNLPHNLHVYTNNQNDNEITEDSIESNAEKNADERIDSPVSVSSSNNESHIHQSEKCVPSSNDVTVPPEEEISESLEKSSKMQMLEALIEKFGYDFIMNKLEDIEPSTES